MATHKSLKVTTWTRIRDTIKGLLLYGSFSWSRASDGLKPPKLSPRERKLAAPTKNLELVKPRENALNAVIKAQPKKVTPKQWDVTAGAIVSDPLMDEDGAQQPFAKRHQPEPQDPLEPSEEHGEIEANGHEGSELVREEIASENDDMVIVRRRKRHRNQSLLPRRAPRTAVQYVGNKPGLLARWFGLK